MRRTARQAAGREPPPSSGKSKDWRIDMEEKFHYEKPELIRFEGWQYVLVAGETAPDPENPDPLNPDQGF